MPHLRSHAPQPTGSMWTPPGPCAWRTSSLLWHDDPANAVILYVGDYDQAGVLIDKAIERRLRDFLAAWDWPGELTFTRLAVNNDQIDTMALPTRPPKASDTRSKEVTRAVEAEAIPAPTMRGIVSAALQDLIPEQVLRQEKMIEEQEQNDVYSRLIIA